MSGVVHFRTDQGTWAVDVRFVRRIVRARALRPLPDPRPGVAGLLEGPGGPLPVLAALGSAAGHHIVVLEVRGRAFGLMVDEVTGVVRDDRLRLGPAPAGQGGSVVQGTVDVDDGTVLLVDADALADRL